MNLQESAVLAASPPSLLALWQSLRVTNGWTSEALSTEAQFQSATALRISRSEVRALPDFPSILTALKELYCDNTLVSVLPASIGLLTGLTKLWLEKNQLTALPETIGLLTNLKILYVEKNQLSRFPDSIVDLPCLEEISASSNKLSRLPDLIGKLTSLKYLYLGYDFNGNQISSIPESITLLSKLEILNIKNNPVYSIPEGTTTLPCYANSFYLKTLRLNKPYVVMSAESGNWAEIASISPRLICLPSFESVDALDVPTQVKLSRVMRDCIGTAYRETSVVYERIKAQVSEATRVFDRYMVQIHSLQIQLRQLQQLAREYDTIRKQAQAQLDKLQRDYFGLLCLDLSGKSASLAREVDKQHLAIQERIQTREGVESWGLNELDSLAAIIAAPIDNTHWKQLEMDGKKLLQQTDDSLRSNLKMSVLGDRLRMVRAIDLLSNNRGEEILPPTDPIHMIRRDERNSTSTIVRWLQQNRLGAYVPDFWTHRVTVDCLPYLNVQHLVRDLSIPQDVVSSVYRALNELVAFLQRIPPVEFLCPVSNRLMADPVIGPDGRTYDRFSLDATTSTQGSTNPNPNPNVNINMSMSMNPAAVAAYVPQGVLNPLQNVQMPTAAETKYGIAPLSTTELMARKSAALQPNLALKKKIAAWIEMVQVSSMPQGRIIETSQESVLIS